MSRPFVTGMGGTGLLGMNSNRPTQRFVTDFRPSFSPIRIITYESVSTKSLKLASKGTTFVKLGDDKAFGEAFARTDNIINAALRVHAARNTTSCRQEGPVLPRQIRVRPPTRNQRFPGLRVIAVIASIYQPSSRLSHSFDKVLLLYHGRALYSGPGIFAPAQHFSARGIAYKEV